MPSPGYGENGSVVGPQNLPTSSVASGVWSLGEMTEAQRDGTWPNPVVPLTLSGGTDFTDGGITYHKFTSSGTLTINGTGLVEYVIVGGGGGGGANSSSTAGTGGGGGGGGIAWGTNYLLDSSVRTTFTITIGTGGAAPGFSGSESAINDWGKANDNLNFDFSGGTSYSTTADKVSAGAGGGGGKGQYGVCNSGVNGNIAGTSSTNWSSAGSTGGGGGWQGYCAGGGSQSPNPKAGTITKSAGINTIFSLNSDGTQATHYIVGGQGGVSAGGTDGEQGVSTLSGTLFSSQTFNGSISGSGGDLNAGNRGIYYAGIGLATAGTGGAGNWRNANDGGGRGGNQGGPINAATNQGGGGAGGASNDGGTGGSGVIIFRVIS